ncbi:hypothetical protein BKA80DRAFT_74429 [Phyllosticta citrichinensis]
MRQQRRRNVLGCGGAVRRMSSQRSRPSSSASQFCAGGRNARPPARTRGWMPCVPCRSPTRRVLNRPTTSSPRACIGAGNNEAFFFFGLWCGRSGSLEEKRGGECGKACRGGAAAGGTERYLHALAATALPPLRPLPAWTIQSPQPPPPPPPPRPSTQLHLILSSDCLICRTSLAKPLNTFPLH